MTTQQKRGNPGSGTAESANSREAAESEIWQMLGELWFSFKPVIMDCCREFDLYPPQLMVIQNLDRPRPMSEVAGFLACNNSNLTGITDRLEDRNLVRRTADPSDRRVKLLVLTEEGEAMRKQILEQIQRPPESMAGLTDRDLEQFRSILTKLGSPTASA